MSQQIQLQGQSQLLIILAQQLMLLRLHQQSLKRPCRNHYELLEQGLFLVGLDTIGGQMTEINVTSPTCFQEIERFGGGGLQVHFYDCVEMKLATRN